MDQMTTYEAGGTFAELICADPQWLDEEFSALMAANFTAPPVWPRPPAPPTFPPAGRPRPAPPGQPVRPGHSGLALAGAAPRRRAPGRQRSPPL